MFHLPRNNSVVIIVGFILLVSLSLFLSGCGGSNKQMCFCHSRSYGFDHWYFIHNTHPSSNVSDFFLFKGNADDCHKACNTQVDLPEEEKVDLPEEWVSSEHEHPYLGIEYKLVPVTDKDLRKFAIAAGFAPLAQGIASGNQVNVDKSLEKMYANLKRDQDNADSTFTALLNEPKFAFLNHSYYYCSQPQTVCSSTEVTHILAFNSGLKKGPLFNRLLFDPNHYSCFPVNDNGGGDYETILVVNDKFCWATNGGSSNYYPLCGDLPTNKSKENLPPYGCLCSKDMTFNKKHIVTRFNDNCCENGEIVTCR